MQRRWPHQDVLFEKLLASQGRLIIGDEPGVGKTRPVLDYMRLKGGYILIMVPYNVVLDVWLSQTEQWLQEEVIIYTGNANDREAYEAQLREHRARTMQGGPPTIVAAHIHHQKHLLTSFGWSMVIYDEFHVMGFGNRKSKTFLVAKEHLKAAHVIFMSGTPYGTSLGDLWPPLHLISKTKFRGYWPFINQHYDTHKDFMGHVQIPPNVRNVQNSVELLKPYLIRRTLRHVMPHLPAVVHDFVQVDMTADQARHYNDLVKEAMAWFAEESDDGGNIVMTPNAISKMTRLRQVLVSPQIFHKGEKSLGAGIPAVIELARLNMENNEPTAIFTSFRDGAELIRMHLILNKIAAPEDIYMIMGGDSSGSMEIAKQFQNNPKKRKFLVGTITSAISYTATAARKGIVLGPEYGHRVMNQMIGRLDRANQELGLDPIQFTYIMHRGTVEAKVYGRIREMQSWAAFTLNREDFTYV